MAGKVLFTASTFSHILNFHLPYLEWFRNRGWCVHVACGGDPVVVPFADSVIPCRLQKSLWSSDNFKTALKLRQLIRLEDYSLISTHTSLAAFFTRLALKGMKKRPLVASICHGYLFDGDTPCFKRTLFLTAERLVSAQTDLLMTMNSYDFWLAKRYKLAKRIENIPGMGVDFSKFNKHTSDNKLITRRKYGIPDDAFVIIYPAEFSERKSQKVLIETMTKLPANCVLILPGRGTLLNECRALTDRYNLAGRVIFPGHINDMGSLYSISNAAASASRSEGLPFNVIEAMHFCLPVVASSVKGHSDLISDGVNGFLYPYGDAEACADAIRRLIKSSSLHQELSRNAEKTAELYRLDNVLPEVIKQYCSLS